LEISNVLFTVEDLSSFPVSIVTVQVLKHFTEQRAIFTVFSIIDTLVKHSLDLSLFSTIIIEIFSLSS